MVLKSVLSATLMVVSASLPNLAFSAYSPSSYSLSSDGSFSVDVAWMGSTALVTAEVPAVASMSMDIRGLPFSNLATTSVPADASLALDLPSPIVPVFKASTFRTLSGSFRTDPSTLIPNYPTKPSSFKNVTTDSGLGNASALMRFRTGLKKFFVW